MILSYQELVQLASTGLKAAGIHQKAAFETAQCLALAELDGLASHGMARVSQYAAHAKHGRVELAAKVKVHPFKTSAALVDAGDGLAFPALRFATDLSVNIASKTGVGLVAVTNSHHFGVAGHFAEAAARAGYISLVFGNTPAAMPMVGGTKAIFGTNPLAAAFPIANADPLVIDMSLSAVARGKLLIAAKKGEPIPEGWALTAEGKPTTDPQEGLKGLMVPLGGDKGALLALIVELLVVGLSGSRFSYEADSFFDAKGNRPRIGQLLLTIDPGLAGGRIFANRMQDFLLTLASDSGTRLPGQRRFKQRQTGFVEGVNVSDVVVQEIQAGIRQSWNGQYLSKINKEKEMIHFVVHEPGDVVGVVVVEGVKAGTDLIGWVMDGDTTVNIKSESDIPIGHKIALQDLKTGDTIMKYGVDIGKVVAPIKKGEHTHVQNVKTKRW